MPTESLPDFLTRLRCSAEGLSSAEAERRLKESGLNELTTAKLHSTFVEFIGVSANPLVLILLVAAAASAFLGEIANAAIIGGIVVLSAGLNFWQTMRSERAVSRLREQIAPTATVRRDAAWVE